MKTTLPNMPASDWHDFMSIIPNARGINICKDGKHYAGDADISRDDVTGLVTIKIGKAKKAADKDD